MKSHHNQILSSVYFLHRSLSGIVKKLLDMRTARIGQLSMAKGEDNDVILLADFNEADAQEIIKRFNELPDTASKGLNISICDALPELIKDTERIDLARAVN
ncbi:hypothetical protein EON65_06310 [archaeon]|nr:MAG: hypothetical protein EON65_06310 [archaeon]